MPLTMVRHATWHLLILDRRTDHFSVSVPRVGDESSYSYFRLLPQPAGQDSGSALAAKHAERSVSFNTSYM
jgi:hypothetical protein